MKYWISLVNTVEVDQFVEVAKKAEELGYEGITLPDHLVYPANIETPYPYTEDGKVWWPNTNPWVDPWVALTAMGMATTNLKLATNIYLAALRDPFTAARATGAAAIFTGDRVRCGVSAGWLKEEFAVAGVDFTTRGRRLDEIIKCMRALNTGEVVSFHGEIFHFDDVIMSPAPKNPIPIWVGGKSKAALRRAAENDGWLGVPTMNKEQAEIVNHIFDLRRKNGKYEEPFDVILSPMELMNEEFLGSLDPAGTYHSSVLPWTPSPWGRAPWVKEGEDHSLLETKYRAMERFREMMQNLGIWN